MSDLAKSIAALSPEQRRQVVEQLELKRARTVTSRIPRLARDRDAFPLSFAQERLWFLDQLAPDSPFYNCSSAQRVPFAIDPTALDRALSELARRHEALRTAFILVGGESMQRILPVEPVRCTFTDLGSLSVAAREAEAERLATAAAQQVFDLAAGRLFRAALIRLGPFESVFVFVIHHIVSDAWSLEIVNRELSVLYADALAGRASSLPALTIRYVDFAVWQRDWLKGETLVQELEYWRNWLCNLPTLNLATDRPRPRIQTFRGAHVEIAIPPSTMRALGDVARQQQGTTFMVLLAAFFVLLHRYTGQDDLVVGVPVANRNHTEIESVVGFFTNSIVLRADLSGNPTFLEVLRRVRTLALEAYGHQDLPFAKLVAALRPEHDLSRNPLFQVSFQLISQFPEERSTAARAEPRAVAFERGTAIFDLVVNLWELAGGVRGVIEFNTDLFESTTVAGLVQHYVTLLETVAETPSVPVGALTLLSDIERRQILVEWNATAADYPADESIHGLFEQQAARTPLAIAARRGANSLTEPSTPSDRLTGMIEEATIWWIITTTDLKSRVPAGTAQIFLIDSGRVDGDTGRNIPPLGVASRPGLAYVIFTSGSTGRPKGVMISHRGVVNYLSWCLRNYPVDSGIGAPLCSPISSDMSVTSLFVPLLSGKAVVLLDEEEVVDALDTALRDGSRFSFVKLTPSHTEALRNLSIGRDVPCATAAFIIGGETLHGETLAPWREHCPDIMVFNEYGPTETVVGCCVHATRAGDVKPGPVPIGRPIANTLLYVLDRYASPVPIGVPGELHIGGAGVALGYINRPELTAERFLPNPFSGSPSDLLYRTGDLVRYRPDGTLEYLGRCDDQVKIRGYRVEPGDVETALREHGNVADAAVLARDFGGNDLRLVAYVVPPSGGTLDAASLADDLRRHVRDKLPSYMIPSSFILIDAIPRTPSGKADRRALEQISRENPTHASPAAPRTSLEEVIARVFRDVLKVETVGVDEDFFTRLGGHSLLATKAVARIRELLQVELPLRTVFESPTVAGLARALTRQEQIQSRLERTAEVVVRLLDMSEEEVGTMLAAPLGGERSSSTPDCIE